MGIRHSSSFSSGFGSWCPHLGFPGGHRWGRMRHEGQSTAVLDLDECNLHRNDNDKPLGFSRSPRTIKLPPTRQGSRAGLTGPAEPRGTARAGWAGPGRLPRPHVSIGKPHFGLAPLPPARLAGPRRYRRQARGQQACGPVQVPSPIHARRPLLLSPLRQFPNPPPKFHLLVPLALGCFRRGRSSRRLYGCMRGPHQ